MYRPSVPDLVWFSMSRQISGSGSPILYCMSNAYLLYAPTTVTNLRNGSYTVHCAFAIMCPLNFLFLMAKSSDSPRSIYNGLRFALTEHISATRFDKPLSFPVWGFVRLAVILAVSISIPALLWFIAITLAPYVHLHPSCYQCKLIGLC